jgi:hypothetical protein
MQEYFHRSKLAAHVKKAIRLIGARQIFYIFKPILFIENNKEAAHMLCMDNPSHQSSVNISAM